MKKLTLKNLLNKIWSKRLRVFLNISTLNVQPFVNSCLKWSQLASKEVVKAMIFYNTLLFYCSQVKIGFFDPCQVSAFNTIIRNNNTRHKHIKLSSFFFNKIKYFYPMCVRIFCYKIFCVLIVCYRIFIWCLKLLKSLGGQLYLRNSFWQATFYFRPPTLANNLLNYRGIAHTSDKEPKKSHKCGKCGLCGNHGGLQNMVMDKQEIKTKHKPRIKGNFRLPRLRNICSGVQNM